MTTSVYGIARSTDQAAAVVGRLKMIGFADNDISVLMADKSGSRDFAHEHNTKAPEGATTGAGVGGLMGGALGLLAGIGALAIPGVGPFIAVGPIMGALSGAAVGGVVGGLAGALIGLGIPEYEAKRFEGKIMGGNVLISVHAVDAAAAKKAESALLELGVEDVHSASEATPDIKVTPQGTRQRA